MYTFFEDNDEILNIGPICNLDNSFENQSFITINESNINDPYEKGFDQALKSQVDSFFIPIINDNFNPKINQIFDIKKITKRGRKRKNDISERNHNKNSEDNIIRKIKVNMFKYAIKIINKNSEKNKIKYLDYKERSNLKRDDNIDMFNKTLKEIFLDIGPSQKYREDRNHNRNLIDKIYKGKIKEEKVKKILDLTFLDLLEICKGNEEKINKLKQEKIKGYKPFIEFIFTEKKKKEVSSDYIEKVKNLINYYEKWFKNKKGRK